MKSYSYDPLFNQIMNTEGSTIVMSFGSAATKKDIAVLTAAPDLLYACKEALKELQFHNWHNTTTGMLLERVIGEATNL